MSHLPGIVLLSKRGSRTLTCVLQSERTLKARSHVFRFQCASIANRIECALDAHRLRSHGTTGKQIRSELWRAWVS